MTFWEVILLVVLAVSLLTLGTHLALEDLHGQQTVRIVDGVDRNGSGCT